MRIANCKLQMDIIVIKLLIPQQPSMALILYGTLNRFRSTGTTCTWWGERTWAGLDGALWPLMGAEGADLGLDWAWLGAIGSSGWVLVGEAIGFDR